MYKIFRLFLIFIPWTLFSMAMRSSASNNIKTSIWLALLIFLIVFNLKLIKQLEVIVITNILVFIVVFLNYSHAWSVFLMQHPATGCYGALALIAASSIAVKKPFTMKYAGDDIPEEKKKHYLFIRINSYITAVWVLVFFTNAVINYYSGFTIETRVISLGVASIGILSSVLLPTVFRNYYRRKNTKTSRHSL